MDSGAAPVDIMDSGVDSDSTDTDGVAALENDIVIFETKSEVPAYLGWHVYSSPHTHIRWYKELSKAWRETKPKDPVQATKLVYDTLKRIHTCGVHVEDIEGLLHFYGLPYYYLVLESLPYDESSLVADDAQAPWVVDGPAFQLSTLPVEGRRVTDGMVFAVSVEVEDKDFYLLPQEILFAVSERRKALVNGDDCRALEMQKLINTTQDYEVVNIDDMEFLARKYQIRLRGIRAPKIGTRYGTKARDELAKLVNGKCLTIVVYDVDDERRCVGDVYSIGNSLKDILLKKAAELPWGWKADSQ